MPKPHLLLLFSLLLLSPLHAAPISPLERDIERLRLQGRSEREITHLLTPLATAPSYFTPAQLHSAFALVPYQRAASGGRADAGRVNVEGGKKGKEKKKVRGVVGRWVQRWGGLGGGGGAVRAGKGVNEGREEVEEGVDVDVRGLGMRPRWAVQ